MLAKLKSKANSSTSNSTNTSDSATSLSPFRVTDQLSPHRDWQARAVRVTVTETQARMLPPTRPTGSRSPEAESRACPGQAEPRPQCSIKNVRKFNGSAAPSLLGAEAVRLTEWGITASQSSQHRPFRTLKDHDCHGFP
eukprot:1440420-Rhodomonas_salina.1